MKRSHENEGEEEQENDDDDDDFDVAGKRATAMVALDDVDLTA